MKKVALISQKQFRQLTGTQIGDHMFFNPWMDKWGNLLISEEEIIACVNPDVAWVHDLPLYHKADIQKNLDTTVPASDGIKINIITKFKWLFPIKFNGFIIELKTLNNVDYIEHSILTWTDLWFEWNKPQNEDVAKVLKPFVNHINDVTNHI